MAAASNSHNGFRRRAEYGELRDAAELRSFFCDAEATVGFRSTFSAMLAAANGVSFGMGSPESWDPYAAIVGQLSASKRVRRALAEIPQYVQVLYRLYGPNPASGWVGVKELGDVAPLATLTEAVERAREDLVVRSTMKVERIVEIAVSASQEEAKNWIELEFWFLAGRVLKLESRLASTRIKQKTRTVLERKHASSLEFQRRLLDAYEYDGVVRAKIGVIASADRTVTHEDAIRDALKKDVAERSAFVIAVKKETATLKTDAHRAYRAARERQ